MNKRKLAGKLAAYGLGIGGCGAMLAGTADAAVVDATFPFGNVLDKTTGNGYGNVNGGGLGAISWSANNYGIALAGLPYNGNNVLDANGFYNGAEFSLASGGIEDVSNLASSTFGTSGAGLPNQVPAGNGNNKGNFYDFYDSPVDVGGITSSRQGVVGFRTNTHNWGFVEFDWDRDNFVMTILSAKIETDPNVAITFNPVPEPSSLALLSLGATGLLMRRKRKVAKV